MKRFASLCTAMGLMVSASVSLAQAAVDRKIDFSLPAQAMPQALNAFAEQANVMIVFSADDAIALRAEALKGTFTTREALDQLLEHTQLIYRFVGEKTVEIRRSDSAPLKQQPSEVSGSMKATSLASDERIHLAQVESRAEKRPMPLTHPPADGGDEMKPIDQVVVTGSHIRGRALAGVDILTVSRAELLQSGRSTVAEALQTQSQMHGSGPGEGTSSVGRGAGNLGFGASLNLRGLGAEETLTLLNGRRLAPSGLSGQFVDASLVPLGAIERVEILADGASATYGADAMAGVVNVVLRDKFQGAETRVRFGSVTSGSSSDFQASQLVGTSWSSGSIAAAYEFSRRGSLDAASRDYAASCDLRAFGGTNSCSRLSSPGNISSPIQLAGAIPPGQDGTTLQVADLRLGQANLQNTHLGVDIFPELRRNSVFIALQQSLTPAIRAYVNLFGSDRESRSNGIAQNTTLVVPASNAFRQLNGLHGPGALGSPIVMDYSFINDLGATPTRGVGRAGSATVGAVVDLASSWQLDVYGQYGRSKARQSSPLLDTRSAAQGGALALALESSDLRTAFNPFGDGGASDPAVLSSLLVPFYSEVETDFSSATAKADGTLFTLTGGDVRLAFGTEYKEENFESSQVVGYRTGIIPTSFTPPIDGRRTATSAFAELSVPLIGENNSMRAVQSLDISLSARYDDYSDFGTTLNPKLGFTWKPAANLDLRGTYGTSFKAPLLQNLFTSTLGQVVSVPASLGGPDVNGDGFTRLLIVSGGNRKLDPEKGRTWTAGIDFNPVALDRLRLQATYFNIRFEDRFATLASAVLPFANSAPYLGTVYFPAPNQPLVDAYIASASQLLTPAPLPGTTEAIVDTSVRNLSVVTMKGVDLSGAFRTSLQQGNLTIFASATYTAAFEQNFTAAAPTQDLLNRVAQPLRWKARAGAAWQRGPFNMTLFGNYVSSYTDTESVPNRPVASWLTFDLAAGYDLGALIGSDWTQNLLASASVQNALDKEPPFVNSAIGGAYGFDAANANAWGRVAVFEVIKKW